MTSLDVGTEVWDELRVTVQVRGLHMTLNLLKHNFMVLALYRNMFGLSFFVLQHTSRHPMQYNFVTSDLW